MTDRPAHTKPLAGIRVLDFSHAAAGPFATMFLGDLGAEVIKIEKPGRGDGTRYSVVPLLGPRMMDYFLSLNRNKKSVAIDLGTPAGVALARGLAARCDVAVQNFRPGVMERLGLGFADLAPLRRGLVYCSVTAFGPGGPWRDLPANDITMQAVTGMMGMTGEVDGGPVRIGAAISDHSTALFAMSGVLAALLARDRHPEGQLVEVNMFDAAMAMMCNYIPTVSGLGHRVPKSGPGHHTTVPYRAFRCGDGGYLMIGAFTNKFFHGVCRAVGHPEWIDDHRFVDRMTRVKYGRELYAMLEPIMLTRACEEWRKLLEAEDVPAVPVLELNEAIQLEQARHNQSIQRLYAGGKAIDLAACPIRSQQWLGDPDRVAPRLGADTRQVLSDVLQLSAGEIGDLVAQGVIGLEG